MKTLRLLAASVLLVAVLGACSDDAGDSTPSVVVDEQAAENETPGDDATQDEATQDEATQDEATQDEATQDEATGGEVVQLTGVVGTPDDPSAFEIALLDADGQVVEQLPAGRYVIDVNDLSQIHNWHLVGPGDVDVQTSVGDVETETFQVTLERGEYTYVCDPHSNSMVGTFEVV